MARRPSPADARRSVSVTVKMSKEDLERLKKVADCTWPGAMITSSSMLLSFAKLGADCAEAGFPHKTVVQSGNE